MAPRNNFEVLQMQELYLVIFVLLLRFLIKFLFGSGGNAPSAITAAVVCHCIFLDLKWRMLSWLPLVDYGFEVNS